MGALAAVAGGEGARKGWRKGRASPSGSQMSPRKGGAGVNAPAPAPAPTRELTRPAPPTPMSLHPVKAFPHCLTKEGRAVTHSDPGLHLGLSAAAVKGKSGA